MVPRCGGRTGNQQSAEPRCFFVLTPASSTGQTGLKKAMRPGRRKHATSISGSKKRPRRLRRRGLGAQYWIRTSTTLRSPPPQDGVSTNFTNWAIIPHSFNLCPEQDSNLHTLRRCRLKTVRLPISPSGHCKERGANIRKIAEFLNETARLPLNYRINIASP